MNNFWKKTKLGFLALAPMAGVADSAFRRICKPYGADILYSEMASATALSYDPNKTLELLRFDDIERPCIVQLFGSRPEHFAKAAKIVQNKIAPDGIDINLGCPVKKVQKQGAGAVLMKNVSLARDCIKAVVDNTSLPVSVKTRTKVEDVSVLEFLEKIASLDVKALMIHGRTLSQGFSGEIDTEVIKKVRGYFGGVIIANGGIKSPEDARRILKETGADGLGIARGCLGRPWIFEEIKNNSPINKSVSEIFEIALRHAELTYELKKNTGIIEMRKHLCWYASGLKGAKELRKKFIRVESLEEVKSILSGLE